MTKCMNANMCVCTGAHTTMFHPQEPTFVTCKTENHSIFGEDTEVRNITYFPKAT